MNEDRTARPTFGLREIAWCAGTALLVYALLTAAFVLGGGQ